jgi:hypothetical protein
MKGARKYPAEPFVTNVLRPATHSEIKCHRGAGQAWIRTEFA